MAEVNVYKEAMDFASLLRDKGLTSEAVEIEDAISGGATGTEICMALQYHLGQLSAKLQSEQLLSARAKRLEARLRNLLAGCDT